MSDGHTQTRMQCQSLEMSLHYSYTSGQQGDFNSVSTITATFKLVPWASPIPFRSADHFQYRHAEEGLET